jgi:hypothetical protein
MPPEADPGMRQWSMWSRTHLRRCLPTPREYRSQAPSCPICMPVWAVLSHLRCWSDRLAYMLLDGFRPYFLADERAHSLVSPPA